jgi:hypothetical protein
MARKFVVALVAAFGGSLLLLASPADARIVGVCSNVATTSNVSNGSASIQTGNASATGNSSSSSVSQSSAGGGALSLPNQRITIINNGSASANTGGNTAIGNNSINTATNNQTSCVAAYLLTRGVAAPARLGGSSASSAGPTSFFGPRSGAFSAASFTPAVLAAGQVSPATLRTLMDLRAARGIAQSTPGSSTSSSGGTLLPLAGVVGALGLVHVSLLRLLRKRSAAAAQA